MDPFKTEDDRQRHDQELNEQARYEEARRVRLLIDSARKRATIRAKSQLATVREPYITSF